MLLMGKSSVVQELRHATYTVAAHHGFAAVGVENAHPSVGNVRGADHYDAVAAHPLMPVGKAYGEGLGVFYILAEAVKVHIVIAAAVHFREFQGPHNLPPILCSVTQS